MNICASTLADPPPSRGFAVPTLRRPRVLAVGVIGPGRVGSALLDQLRAAQPRLARDSGLELKLCGVVASKRMWLDCDDVELNGRHGGAQIWRPNDLDAFAEHVRGSDGRHALLI
ncbi:MAG: homoserine dehydrogenase, partial [Rhodanobacter sp.]